MIKEKVEKIEDAKEEKSLKKETKEIKQPEGKSLRRSCIKNLFKISFKKENGETSIKKKASEQEILKTLSRVRILMRDFSSRDIVITTKAICILK